MESHSNLEHHKLGIGSRSDLG
jgi:hypothetical protein